MTMTPHIEAHSRDFPGDPSPQPLFGVRDSLRSLPRWSLGLSLLFAWGTAARLAIAFDRPRWVERFLKKASRSIPAGLGIEVIVKGVQQIDSEGTYVYIANHVNIFDMFVLYQAIPQYTRGLEHIDHFSWPVIGPIITAAGQIPVDPSSRRTTAKGLRRATEMLRRGESITVLPEGSRTLDGSLGRFFPGAFRLAIGAGVPVVPIAISNGRAVSRRGDWRIRPGRVEVRFGEPVPTDTLTRREVSQLAEQCRKIIIDLLHNRPSGNKSQSRESDRQKNT